MSKHRELVEQAIKLKGTQANLAAAMGCSQQQISYLLAAKRISAEMAVAIDRATDGVVSKEVLRPDLYGRKVLEAHQ